LRFTSDDLTTEIYFEWSDGWDLLWLFELQESQISTENSRTYFCSVHDPSTHVPLYLAIQIHFGSSRFKNLNSQLKLQCNLPEACDILSRVSLDLTVQSPSTLRLFGPSVLQRFDVLVFGASALRLFGLQEFQILCTHLNKVLLPKIHDLLTRIPLEINGQDLLWLFFLLLVHKSSKLWELRHISTLTLDGSDWLQNFETSQVHSLVHFQRVRPHALSLGSNDCWYSCSDLTD